ncbi:cardiolipin synthase [uncultured Shimia sp.]|uniref:cardiolipin synthase n=1 Tax=uncultured Shimia sp. TaxID=573152 RepID=UPI0025D4E3DC|nr:cardiolipin synthase [uncultured Shimia sp.]
MGTFLAIFLVLLELTALVMAWRAIQHSRTSQGAVGWVVFLIAAPYISVPAYLFLGHHKFQHYVTGRRDSEEVIERIQEVKEALKPKVPPEFPTKALEAISDLPVTRGNAMELLIDGQEAFDAIFTAIDGAQSYILLQFYIIRDDGLGRRLQSQLIAAAKRGVFVRVLYDPIGCVKLPHAYRQALRDAGIQIVEPSQMRVPKNRFQLNFRNHRKTVVIDGTTAFTGGLNVGDEYLGLNPYFGNWRDTHVQLKGPVVSQLQLIFAEDWHWTTEENLLTNLNWQSGRAEEDMSGLVVPTGPGDKLETGAMFFFSALANAKERVWIASPYFVPDVHVLTAIKHAALNGVDVRILLPDSIDHKMVWLAAFAYFDEVREAGAQIWRYTDGFMHQKAVLVDDTLAAVGTTNMDNRSFILNFETMAVMFDARAADDLEDMFKTDFAKSFLLEKTLNEQPLRIQIGAPITRLFSPLL